MRTTTIIAAAVLAVSATAAAWPAEAREIRRSGSVTGPRGTTTYGSTATRVPGQGATVSRSATGPYGGTVTRDRSRTNNGDGTYSTSATTTGPNGRSVTRSGTVAVSP